MFSHRNTPLAEQLVQHLCMHRVGWNAERGVDDVSDGIVRVIGGSEIVSRPPIDDLCVIGLLPLDIGEVEQADLPWCVLPEPTLRHRRRRSLTGRQALVRKHGKEQRIGVRPVAMTLYHQLRKFRQVWMDVTPEHDVLVTFLGPFWQVQFRSMWNHMTAFVLQ